MNVASNLGNPVVPSSKDLLAAPPSKDEGHLVPLSSKDDPPPAAPTTYPLYSSNSDSKNRPPLSMRMLHKPSRANDELNRASDPTRRNSLQNSLSASPPTASQLASSPPHSPSSTLSIDTHNIPDLPEPHDLLQPPLPELLRLRLVRKKSGEVVKSSLKDHRSPSHTRSKSLPSTPSGKSVHFGSGNDIRYFSRKDTPTAILALNSPSFFPDDDDDDDDYDDMPGLPNFDYLDDELNSHVDSLSFRNGSNHDSPALTHYPNPQHTHHIDWLLHVLNFPRALSIHKMARCNAPVFLDQVFLSIDKKYLLGHIAVKNIAFEKTVTVRYTADNWATIIEVPTIYVPDNPQFWREQNYDRFILKIPLDSLFSSFYATDVSPTAPAGTVGSQERTYQVCIRYNLPHSEYWDNNHGQNYCIKLVRTVLIRKQQQNPVLSSSKPKFSNKKMNFPALKAPAASPPKSHHNNQKPKYLSHYLKRIHSDSSILNPSSNLSGSSYSHSDRLTGVDALRKHSRKHHNDFARKNFKLSPSLSSSLETEPSTESLFTGENSTQSSTVELEPREQPSPLSDIESSPTVLDERRNKLSEFKSYKELLDSYCFFRPPSTNGKPLGLDESGMKPKEPGDPAIDPVDRDDHGPFFENAFTISTFLRH